MSSNVLTKEQFVNVIENLERLSRFEDELYDVYTKYGGNSPDSPYDSLFNQTIHILNTMYELEETREYGSDIDYYCYELDYGRNPNDLAIFDENNNRIPLNTAEDLYNLIIKRKGKME